MSDYPLPSQNIRSALQSGLVIPAHPLALDENRHLDERRQIALTRYYHAAGAGGLAVGVHSTQFEIRDPKYGLYEQVLKLAAEEIAVLDERTGRTTVKIAGITGPTEQAVQEASWAYQNGYDLGLLSLSAQHGQSIETMLQHCRRIARGIPLMGFYLQPAVGGVILPYSFWQQFTTIPNLVGIKVAPFDRYQTLDVIRAVAESDRREEIALYTGNDDHILYDLLSRYSIQTASGPTEIQFKGGLLGHWACWTRRAVEIFARCQRMQKTDPIPADLLILAAEITDCNAAFFDAANQFKGVLSGIHEVLRRQGLMANNYCLNPSERLSAGQSEEIDRVYAAYPHLNDDDYVHEHLHEWLN